MNRAHKRGRGRPKGAPNPHTKKCLCACCGKSLVSKADLGKDQDNMDAVAQHIEGRPYCWTCLLNGYYKD